MCALWDPKLSLLVVLTELQMCELWDPKLDPRLGYL